MNENGPAPEQETRPPEAAQEPRDGFRAELPLAILESVRQHDRPTEVLQDEDLTASLPRRLGLTGVVDNQIRRYEDARKRRERIPAAQVVDLLRLVLRRPDSEPILREAGYSLARQHGQKPLYRLAGLARLLPAVISERIAKRSVRRLIRRIGGGAGVRVVRKPFRVEVRDPITAFDQYGVACILYSAAIEEAFRHATGHRPVVDHTQCQGTGAPFCVWEVSPEP